MPKDRNEAINEVFRDMMDLLPVILTETNPASASTYTSFVKSLCESEGTRVRDIYDFKDNINILTAASGIDAWEDLLEIPRREDLNIANRQSRVFSRLSGNPCTVTTIKNIIRNYVGSDYFSIFEYHTLNDPASAFIYEVNIQRPASNPYDEESLLLDLQRVQPAHCTVKLVDKFDTFYESFTFTESASGEIRNYIIINSSLINGKDLIAPYAVSGYMTIGTDTIGGPQTIG